MPTTKTIDVFTFDELTDSAKEKARDWYRSMDDEWWDCCYEDFATIADLLGIDLRQRPVKLMGGGTRYEPAIYFSGFSSQGDGACFEGTYSYRKGSVKAINGHCNDDELLRIAINLQKIQRASFYRITASITHHGHYNHSGCMDIDVDGINENTAYNADSLRSCLTDFADWMYRQLEREYDYQNADEQVDENIRCNAYEFDDEGNRI